MKRSVICSPQLKLLRKLDQTVGHGARAKEMNEIGKVLTYKVTLRRGRANIVVMENQ
jgi:hypothetical protein